jgi:predicted regulator of Ras-like GTPase activity (Roadblock/LC7/MglB family)
VPEVNIKDIISEMASDLAGIRLITLLDSDSMMLASWESPENQVLPEALGQFIQQINSTINTFKKSDTGATKLDDLILSTSSGYILLKPICNGACFVVVDTPRTVSLGSIRTACIKYTPRLEQAVPGYEPLPQLDGMGTIVPQD